MKYTIKEIQRKAAMQLIYDWENHMRDMVKYQDRQEWAEVQDKWFELKQECMNLDLSEEFD